jgi:hypothetical protein
VWLTIGWPLAGWGSLSAVILAGLGPYAAAVLVVEGRFAGWRAGRLWKHKAIKASGAA